MSPQGVLLDTHAWIWWIKRCPDLTSNELYSLDGLSEEDRPVLCDISIWETALLAKRGRIAVAGSLREWLLLATRPRLVKVMPIDAAVAAEVALLPESFHGDPADRLIVATAKAYGLRVLTRDRRILDSGLIDLWTPN